MPYNYNGGSAPGDAPPVFSVGRRRNRQSTTDTTSDHTTTAAAIPSTDQTLSSPGASSLEASGNDTQTPFSRSPQSPLRSAAVRMMDDDSSVAFSTTTTTTYTSRQHQQHSPPLRGGFRQPVDRPFTTPSQPFLSAATTAEMDDGVSSSIAAVGSRTGGRVGGATTSFLIQIDDQPSSVGVVRRGSHSPGADYGGNVSLRAVGSGGSSGVVFVNTIDDFRMDDDDDGSGSDDTGDHPLSPQLNPAAAGAAGNRGPTRHGGAGTLFTEMPSLGGGNAGRGASSTTAGGPQTHPSGFSEMGSTSFSTTVPATSGIQSGSTGQHGGSGRSRGNLPMVSIDLSKSVQALHQQNTTQHQHQQQQYTRRTQQQQPTGGAGSGISSSQQQQRRSSKTDSEAVIANHQHPTRSLSGSRSNNASHHRHSAATAARGRAPSSSEPASSVSSPVTEGKYFNFTTSGGSVDISDDGQDEEHLEHASTAVQARGSVAGGGGGDGSSRRGTSAGGAGSDVRGRAVQQKIAEMERRESALLRSQRRQADAVERKVFFGEHRTLQRFVSWLTYSAHAAIAGAFMKVLSRERNARHRRERRGMNPLVALRLRQLLRRVRTRLQGRGVPRPTVALLRTDKLLNLFPDAQLQHAIDHMTLKYFFENENIIMMGSEDDEAYVLHSGVADVLMGQTKVFTMRSGMCFGTVGMISGEPRTASIVARERDGCLAWVLTRAVFSGWGGGAEDTQKIAAAHAAINDLRQQNMMNVYKKQLDPSTLGYYPMLSGVAHETLTSITTTSTRPRVVRAGTVISAPNVPLTQSQPFILLRGRVCVKVDLKSWSSRAHSYYSYPLHEQLRMLYDVPKKKAAGSHYHGGHDASGGFVGGGGAKGLHAAANFRDVDVNAVVEASWRADDAKRGRPSQGGGRRKQLSPAATAGTSFVAAKSLQQSQQATGAARKASMTKLKGAASAVVFVKSVSTKDALNTSSELPSLLSLTSPSILTPTGPQQATGVEFDVEEEERRRQCEPVELFRFDAPALCQLGPLFLNHASAPPFTVEASTDCDLLGIGRENLRGQDVLELATMRQNAVNLHCDFVRAPSRAELVRILFRTEPSTSSTAAEHDRSGADILPTVIARCARGVASAERGDQPLPFQKWVYAAQDYLTFDPNSDFTINIIVAGELDAHGSTGGGHLSVDASGGPFTWPPIGFAWFATRNLTVRAKTQVDAIRIQRKDLISFVCREVLHEYLNSTAGYAASAAGTPITHLPSTSAHHDVLYQLLKYLGLRYAKQTGSAPEFSTFGLEFGLMDTGSVGGMGASLGGGGGGSRRRSVAASSLSRRRSTVRADTTAGGGSGSTTTAASRLSSFYKRRTSAAGASGASGGGSFSTEGTQPLWFIVAQSLMSSVVASIRKLIGSSSAVGGGGGIVDMAALNKAAAAAAPGTTSTPTTTTTGSTNELVGSGGRRHLSVSPTSTKAPQLPGGGNYRPVPPPARSGSTSSAIGGWASPPRPSSPKSTGRPIFPTGNHYDDASPRSTPHKSRPTEAPRDRPSSARILRNVSPPTSVIMGGVDRADSYHPRMPATPQSSSLTPRRPPVSPSTQHLPSFPHPLVVSIDAELIRVGSMNSNESGKSSSASRGGSAAAQASSSSSSMQPAHYPRRGGGGGPSFSGHHHDNPLSYGSAPPQQYGGSAGGSGGGAQAVLHQFLMEAMVAKGGGGPPAAPASLVIDRGESVDQRVGTPRGRGSGGGKTQYLPVKHKKPSGGLGHTPRAK